MTPDVIFSTANLVAALSWVLLIFAGRVGKVPRLITGAAVPLLLATLYTAVIAAQFGSSEGGFGSISEVRTLFANDWLLVAGWVHYLAFDLFVGSWEVRDAVKHRIPHLAVVPCLILTFLFGPAGLLLYGAVRFYRTRSLAIES